MGEISSSLGQDRIRVDYNRDDNSYINLRKIEIAKLIDAIHLAVPNPEWHDSKFREWSRLNALAMTTLEEASMWITKAATI